MRILTFISCASFGPSPFRFSGLRLGRGRVPNIRILLLFVWLRFLRLLYEDLVVDNWLIEWLISELITANILILVRLVVMLKR